MKNSLISVLIPTFNYGRFLGEALDSVLAQTYNNIEIIVVDDGSTDETREVAESYGTKVRYIFQEHAGIGPARNESVKQAKGNYFAFLDSDDHYEPEKLTTQYNALTSNLELDMVFTHVRRYCSSEVGNEFRDRNKNLTEILPGPVTATMLIKKDSFFRVGLFKSGPVGIDQEWYMRRVEIGLMFDMLPDVLYNRRIHENNTGIRATDDEKRHRLKIIKQALDRRRSK